MVVKAVSKPTTPLQPLAGATISQCKAVCEIDSTVGCRSVYWDSIQKTCSLSPAVPVVSVDATTLRPTSLADAVWLLGNRSKVTPAMLHFDLHARCGTCPHTT